MSELCLLHNNMECILLAETSLLFEDSYKFTNVCCIFIKPYAAGDGNIALNQQAMEQFIASYVESRYGGFNWSFYEVLFLHNQWIEMKWTFTFF